MLYYETYVTMHTHVILVAMHIIQGSEAIQAIALPFNLDGIIEVHHEAFSKMDNLRLLIISSQLRFSNGLNSFPSALKVIQWRSYPQDTLPIGTHRLNNLVDIQMPFSKIKHWNDLQVIKIYTPYPNVLVNI